LCFKSLVPQVSTLFYIGILNATQNDPVYISSASLYNDYVMVVNKNDGTVQPFFIPENTYVTIKPPMVSNLALFTETLAFEVLVYPMNSTQS
jgi:hypothetical protein